MELNTRTVYSAYLQTNQLMALPFLVVPFTTLNQRFDIQAGVLPAAGTLPHLGYMSIGNGGHGIKVGANGKPVPTPIQHRATDASLYEPIPFVLRLLSEDLTAVERAKYALRKEVQYQGRTYAAYYLRRIDLTNVVTVMEYRTVENGQTTITSFVPDNSNLFPTPPDLNNAGVNVPTGDYVSASAKINIQMGAAEMDELIHVAEVIYEDPDYAIISEIGLVTGVDKVITVTGQGGSYNFNECIAAQVASHVAAFYPIRFSRNGLEIVLDCGATEPLFKLVSN